MNLTELKFTLRSACKFTVPFPIPYIHLHSLPGKLNLQTDKNGWRSVFVRRLQRAHLIFVKTFLYSLLVLWWLRLSDCSEVAVPLWITWWDSSQCILAKISENSNVWWLRPCNWIPGLTFRVTSSVLAQVLHQLQMQGGKGTRQLKLSHLLLWAQWISGRWICLQICWLYYLWEWLKTNYAAYPSTC